MPIQSFQSKQFSREFLLCVSQDETHLIIWQFSQVRSVFQCSTNYVQCIIMVSITRAGCIVLSDDEIPEWPLWTKLLSQDSNIEKLQLPLCSMHLLTVSCAHRVIVLHCYCIAAYKNCCCWQCWEIAPFQMLRQSPLLIEIENWAEILRLEPIRIEADKTFWALIKQWVQQTLSMKRNPNIQ